MKGEVLVDFLFNGVAFTQGEIRVVKDNEGECFCSSGWMRDLDGGFETKTLSKNESVLLVDTASHHNNVEVQNG